MDRILTLCGFKASCGKSMKKVLFQEEIMWFQKSRCKWLQFWDKNTKYFHGTTVFRRKRQRVEALQDLHGEWILDQKYFEIYDYGIFS